MLASHPHWEYIPAHSYATISHQDPIRNKASSQVTPQPWHEQDDLVRFMIIPSPLHLVNRNPQAEISLLSNNCTVENRRPGRIIRSYSSSTFKSHTADSNYYSAMREMRCQWGAVREKQGVTSQGSWWTLEIGWFCGSVTTPALVL